MRPYQFLAICLLCCSIWACGGKQQAAGSTDSTATSTDAQPAEPKEKWMVLIYDDMRLRDAPNKGGAVLATYKEGSQVLALGEKSPNEETIELRGEQITAHWEKVRGADGKEGWIFGGALTPAPDPAVTALEKELNELNTSDCKAIQKGLDAYAKAMKGKTPEVADQGYVVLNNFLESAVSMLNAHAGDRPDYDQFDLKLNPAVGKLEPKYQAYKDEWEGCGLELQFPEGMLYLALKPGLAIPTLEPLVSKTMRRYLEIRKKEDSHVWMEDGGITITPLELADRAITWDAFVEENPDFVMAKDARFRRDDYAGTLLTGADNTPAIDYDTNKINKEWKAAWDWVLQNKPNTYTGKLVKQWTDILKADNWKRGAKADKFIDDFWKAHEF